MIARRDVLRFSLFALLPAGLVASPDRACAIGVPRLSARRIAPDATVEVEVEVVNESRQPASALVHVYVHDQVASVVRPVLSLAAVKPVALGPGASRIVRVTLGADAFRLPTAAEKRIVEPGLFDIMVGPNSHDLQGATLEIA